jgi:hypothetical protein
MIVRAVPSGRPRGLLETFVRVRADVPRGVAGEFRECLLLRDAKDCSGIGL